ncbi:hypothetical protein NDU88_010398 [Pleurodeles waltl]|uniref:Uncharacterized protein n=1 Tax=Pleurodeles waltl TaxID=8319 RepID=A0AAV7PV09_PLEWA|nr:hypothetical protein NDU88_010398 [Pleurodeles waltl]
MAIYCRTDVAQRGNVSTFNPWIATGLLLDTRQQWLEPRRCSLEITNCKSSGKTSGKPVRQLLFSKAIRHLRLVASSPDLQAADRPTLEVETEQDNTMEQILQEITAVDQRIEGMDSTISMLAIETKTIHSDIARPDREQELLFLHSKRIDLEDRSRRDNVRFLGFPERIEEPNFQAFLQKVLPALTGITFDPPLEFQQAHRLGSKRPDGASRT